MLREIDHKIKENSSKLSLDIQALKNHLKSNTKDDKVHESGKVHEERLFKIVNRVS